MALYLVTGAAGFIGSHLVDALLRDGHRVRGLDNFETGRRANLAAALGENEQAGTPLEPTPGSFELAEADLRDAAAVAHACEGIECIFHEGALPSVPRSVREPRPSHEANIDGTFNLLEGARAAGVRRVVYAASSSAYGNQPGFPRVETMTPAPIAPYPVQKLAGELYMQSYWRVYGLETVCLRYFNIFGPRQVPDSPYSGVMAKFILQMMDGLNQESGNELDPSTAPMIHGDGEQGRDFTYIDNAVSANLLAMQAPAASVAGRVFNVACGERHTLNETYAVLSRLLGYGLPAQYGPPRAGDVRDSLASIEAAREAFGYSPSVDFEEGLARTVAWYRAQRRTREQYDSHRIER
jgi:UDP-glucose 4-epimerase